MNAREYLKGLNEHDPVWDTAEEYEYTEDQLINFAERYHEKQLKLLRIANVSNCTSFNNKKFIRPLFDGTSTAVTQYEVVDELGSFWFKGTKAECEQYLYGC
jgi:hypothetical protein